MNLVANEKSLITYDYGRSESILYPLISPYPVDNRRIHRHYRRGPVRHRMRRAAGCFPLSSGGRSVCRIRALAQRTAYTVSFLPECLDTDTSGGMPVRLFLRAEYPCRNLPIPPALPRRHLAGGMGRMPMAGAPALLPPLLSLHRRLFQSRPVGHILRVRAAGGHPFA